MAYLATHLLSDSPLHGWADGSARTIRELRPESGGAGDDIRAVCEGAEALEIQAKRGLDADQRLEECLQKFVDRIRHDERPVLVVDAETSSRPVQRGLVAALRAARVGDDAELRRVTPARPLVGVAGAFVRAHLRVVSVALDEGNAPSAALALERLRLVLVDPNQAEVAWAALFDICHSASARGDVCTVDYFRRELFDRGIKLHSVPPDLRAAQGLIEKAHPSAALRIIDAADERWEARYLRGIALVRCDQDEDGLALLERCTTERPTSVGAQAHRLAATAAVAGESRALDQLLQLPGAVLESPTGWAMRFRYDQDLQLDDVPAAYRDHPMVLSERSERHRRRGELDSALACMEQASSAERRVEWELQLAELETFAAGQLSQQVAAPMLGRARARLDRALEQLPDSKSSIWRTAARLSALHHQSVGNHIAAVRDLRNLLGSGDTSRSLILLFSEVASMADQGIDDALGYLSQLLEHDENDSEAWAASALLRDGADAERALNRALDSLVPDAPLRVRGPVAAAALRLRRPEAVLELLDERFVDSADDEGVLRMVALARARAFVQLQDTQQALAEYERASRGTDHAWDHHRLDAAAYAIQHDELDRAARLLENVEDTAKADRLRTRIALLQGKLDEARRLGERWVEQQDEATWATHALAFVAERCKRWDELAVHLERWIELQPTAVEPLLNLAHLRLRDGQNEAAQALLDRVPSNSDLGLLIARARLLAESGVPAKAFDAALGLLRLHPHDPAVQKAVATLTHGTALEVEVACVGACVRLQDARGNLHEYSLVRGAPVVVLGECDVAGPLGRLLDGVRVGDKVVLQEAPVPVDATVVGLFDARNRAVQWALDELAKPRPDAEVWALHGTTEELLEQISNVVREKTEREAAALDLVTQHCLPHGVAARGLQLRLEDVYWMLAASDEHVMIVEGPDVSATRTVVDGGRFVVSMSAIQSLLVMEALEDLARVTTELVVPQAVVDSLLSEIASLEHSRRSFHSFGWTNGGLRLHEDTPSNRARSVAALRSAVDWLRSRARVAGLPTDWVNYKKAGMEAITDVDFDTIALACAEQVPLLADDYGFRLLAATVYQVPGASVYAVMSRGAELGTVDNRRKDELVRVMLELGQVHVGPTLGAVRAMLDGTGVDTILSPGLRSLLRICRHPRVSAELAAEIASLVLRESELRVPMYDDSAVQRAFLEAVLGGRDASAREVLVRAVVARFRLLPARCDRMVNVVRAWPTRLIV